MEDDRHERHSEANTSDYAKKKLLVLMVMVSKLFWHWQGVAMEDPKRSKEDHMMMYRVII